MKKRLLALGLALVMFAQAGILQAYQNSNPTTDEAGLEPLRQQSVAEQMVSEGNATYSAENGKNTLSFLNEPNEFNSPVIVVDSIPSFESQEDILSTEEVDDLQVDKPSNSTDSATEIIESSLAEVTEETITITDKNKDAEVSKDMETSDTVDLLETFNSTEINVVEQNNTRAMPVSLLNNTGTAQPMAAATDILDIKIEGNLIQTEARKFLNLLNAERAKARVANVAWDLNLEQVALTRAAEISTRFRISRPNGHTDIAVTYPNIAGELIDVGYKEATSGLANLNSASNLLKEWMNDSGIKSDLLNRNVKSIGLAAFTFEGLYYWVLEITYNPTTSPIGNSKPQNGFKVYDVKTQRSRFIGLKHNLTGDYLIVNGSIDMNTYVYNVGMASGGAGAKVVSSSLAWSTNNAKSLSVTSNGRITALAPGYGTIKAQLHDKSVSKYITVKQPQIEDFVARLYQNVLGRQPDQAGFNNWVIALKTGTNTGAGLADGFFESQELKKKNLSNLEYLRLLYRTIFSREPDPTGQATWMKLLENGVGRRYVANQFYMSREFNELCAVYRVTPGSVALTHPLDQNVGVTMFVFRIYAKALSRRPEMEGHTNWTQAILVKALTPEQVAESFYNSQEFINKRHSNRNYVILLYRTFLDREADIHGLNDWVGQLDRGANRGDILRGFSQSPEFKDIMAKYGL